jgi:FkbM family methyltransferase
MKLIQSFQRPEYVYRPSQILRRLSFEFGSRAGRFEQVRLPWGLPLRVRTDDAVGSVIRRAGVYDLQVCELIGRLLDAGETAADVGANIGQMSSVMAIAVGPTGRVVSFEPHPVLFKEFEQNVASWQADRRVAPVRALNMALGDHAGTARLVVPEFFDANRGTCFIAAETNGQANGEPNGVDVAVEPLDAVLDDVPQVGLMKIDVEGYERQVLSGAGQLLAGKRIRDILFEENVAPPTPVTELLKGSGYSLFQLGGRLRGPVLTPIEQVHDQPVDAPPNYLATLDPARALDRIAKSGWQVLSSRWRSR